MRAIEIFPHRPAQRYRGRALRLAAAGLTIIALVISQSLPMTAMTPPHRAEAIASAPSQSLKAAGAGRLAGDALARLPLRFEAGANQAAGQYLARTGNCNIHLTATEAALVWQTAAGVGRLGCGADLGSPRNAGSLDANEQLPGPRRDRAAPRSRRSTTDASPATALRMQLIGANPHAPMTGEGRPETSTNYFLSNDPKRWRADVPTYQRVKARNVYRGVDVAYYGKAGQFEYDFEVTPGADPALIRLRFAGARRVTVDRAGDLIVETTAGRLRHHSPFTYQEVNGARRQVASRFVLRRGQEVGFAVGAYDRGLPLVIDPVLDFASLFQDGAATGVALDAAGNIYLAGSVFSSCLPTTPGAIQPGLAANSCLNCTEVFITKLDPTGTTLIYSTYLGGSDMDDAAGIAVDASGNACVTGRTLSSNFPVTPGAFQTASKTPCSSRPLDAFVAKLNPTGTALIYSTYLGGCKEDQAAAIAVDASGNAYVAGSTTSGDFPLANPLQDKFIGGTCASDDILFTCTDAFITKLNAAGSPVYSTYIGGSSADYINSLASDSAGNVYATGATTSTNFPVTAGAYQTGPASPGDAGDAFVLKLNAAGSALVYSTYLGGGGPDMARGLAVGADGSVYVTGDTGSTDFPITPQAAQVRSASGSFFISANGGASWSPDSAGLPSDLPIADFAVAPTLPATLYAATNRGLYRSTDGGQSWRVFDFLGQHIQLVELDPQTPTTLYVVVNIIFVELLFKSTDGGVNWERLKPLGEDSGFIFSLVIDPQNPLTLYASTNDADFTAGPPGILKSTNGGLTWQVMNNGFGSETKPATALAIDPVHSATLYANLANRAGVYRTVNGGLKWKRVSRLDSFNSLVISPADSNMIYAATDSGVFKSVNGGMRWRRLDGLSSDAFSSVQLDPAHPSTVYATASAGEIFKSTDGGANWASINAGLPLRKGFLLGIDPQNPATLYGRSGGGADMFITRLNADGSSLLFSTYLGGSADDSARAIALDPESNVYVAGTSGSLDIATWKGLQDAPHKLPRGVSDAFLAKLNSDGSAVLYSTYLGRAAAQGLAVDAAGSAYVVGQTFEGTAMVASLLPQRFGTCTPFFQRDGFVLKITDPPAGLFPPTVAAVNPARAVATGGTEITISGRNFQPGATVRIAGMPANDLRVLNATTIKATTPPAGGRLQNLDVAVINPDGQSNTLVEAFSYVLPPVIGSAAISGKDLLVRGTNFDQDAVIFVDGEPQDTMPQEVTEQITLVGKKLGKRIKPGQMVTLQVQNGSGLLSAPFPFKRPPQ